MLIVRVYDIYIYIYIYFFLIHHNVFIMILFDGSFYRLKNNDVLLLEGENVVIYTEYLLNSNLRKKNSSNQKKKKTSIKFRRVTSFVF